MSRPPRAVRLDDPAITRGSVILEDEPMDAIEQAGLDRVTFAWAGPTEKGFGKGHYYNVKGPTFMLEYDNTQNDANHIHSVWRDFTNDWAEDLLADHLSNHHR